TTRRQDEGGAAAKFFHPTYSTLSGWGTNEGLIISILAHRSPGQCKLICEQYAETYGEVLRKALDKELSNNFEMTRPRRSVHATDSENRMREEIDLLVKVSEHFLTKINNISSTVAIKQIKEKLTEVQLALFRTTCFRKLLVFKSLAI
ncbi:hypothetical protein Dsin_002203, partial [Dipteronia sinensis]